MEITKKVMKELKEKAKGDEQVLYQAIEEVFKSETETKFTPSVQAKIEDRIECLLFFKNR